MSRVAFLLRPYCFEWLGGLNYFATLISAVRDHGSGSVDPVLLTPVTRPDDALVQFADVETHATASLDGRGVGHMARAAGAQLTGHNRVLLRELRRFRIDVLSHTVPVRGVPTISWITDFQHRHLPDLFSARDRASRDRSFRRMTRAARVIVSSEDARADLAAFAPEAEARVRVLHFVPQPPTDVTAGAIAALTGRYGLERYLHLPNQLWAHKNHGVVVEALGLLRDRGMDIVVAATGDLSDYRAQQHVERLRARVHELGLEEHFKLLGRLPYSEVAALMQGAVAVVNPSLFEGWSTTVEEAKSLGKPVALSDLPVHREQDPPGGAFFDPLVPASCAAALQQVWEGEGPATTAQLHEAAAAALPDRRRAFAASYEGIVDEVVAGRVEEG